MGRLALSLALVVGLTSAAQAQKVLVYGPGGTASTSFFPPGSTWTQVSATAWASMTTAQFAAYDVIWIDDGNCATSASIFDAAAQNAAVWAAAVTGRVHITGADMDFHAGPALKQTQAQTYIANSVTWLGAQGHTSAGGKTGLFVEFGCTNGVRADMLAPFGSFTGGHLDGNPTTIDVPGSPLLTGINTVADLKLNSFSHVFFGTYPANFSSLVSLNGKSLDIFALSAGAATPLTLAPTSASVAPGETRSFTASGGTPPYTWSITPNQSNGVISSSGVYTAGHTGSVTDTVVVKDAAGASASASVTVTAGISIVPPSASRPPLGSVMFMATGGSGTGYTWKLLGTQFGSINASTGLYSAGATPNVSDTVQVTDSLQNSATAIVTITAGITITPQNPPNVTVLGKVAFSASGGSNSGFKWTLPGNQTGGTIDQSSGAYVAGPLAGTDTVQVTDSVGGSASTIVVVGAGPSIGAIATPVPPRGSRTLAASGGTPPYSWTFTNVSGGSLTISGGNNVSALYLAGPQGSVNDSVKVTDANGAAAVLTIPVGPVLALAPLGPSIYPHGPVNFVASGGSGVYDWKLTSIASGAPTLDQSGHYTAGALGNTKDVVQVTDSLGSVVTTTVTVTANLTLTPTNKTVAPKSVIAFVASGGGPALTWTIAPNSSGGSITQGGVYTAGGLIGTDQVNVSDGLGGQASATVVVGPGVSILPSPGHTAPLGMISFLASGGGGTFTWSIANSPPHGSIDAATGIYTAGAAANVTDVVKATDQYGNSATAQAIVGDGVSIVAPTTTTPPLGTIQLSAIGGQAPYSWTVQPNPSGGTIDANGLYKAGSIGNQTDTVNVKDSLGNSNSRAITVGPGILVVATPGATGPHGIVTLTAAGGSGSGYVWTVQPGGSGGSIMGNGANATFTAGATANTQDLVTVTDSLGNKGTATISVGGALAIVAPANPKTPPLGALQFVAAGGVPPYSWSLLSTPSNGKIDATTGAYVAGGVGPSADVVQVTDSAGTSVTVGVTVTDGVSISPAHPQPVAPRGQLQLTASGGSGKGFTWKMGSAPSGGTVDANGLYHAGGIGNQTDQVIVTDDLGNSAMVAIPVGPPLAITPADVSLPPLGTTPFAATGGSGAGFTWALAAPAHGTVSATGVYTAGTAGDLVDTVQLSDGNGNSATATVHITDAVAIHPATMTVAPRGTFDFDVTGGDKTGGYAWSFVHNNSGGTLDGATGFYTAGPTGGVHDEIKAVDDLGGVGTADITVGPSLAITALVTTTPPRGPLTFGATGGQPPYTWAVNPNGSGATIDGSGHYVAGTVGTTSDTIVVTDANNSSANVVVSVTAGVSVTPPMRVMAPQESLTFTAAGGSGHGFTWAVSGGSGATIDNSGHYKAGKQGTTTDTITATDDLGNVGMAVVSVSDGVSITGQPLKTPPEGTLTLHAVGGSGLGFVWAILTDCSHGATIDANGLYKAGPNGSCSDMVGVTDSFGNTASASISVGAGITISPTDPTVAPQGSQPFTAVGGAGSGYSWSLQAAPSHGKIDPASGQYSAGPIGSVTDIVQVQDPLGNVATTHVFVSAGLSITASAASTPPKGPVQFSVSGGSGSGYVWSLVAPSSGGTINAQTGAYVAGAIGNVTDRIQVTDSNLNVATYDLLVGPGLSIGPVATPLVPHTKVNVTVTGGLGAGYVWTLTNNPSGGTLVGGGATIELDVGDTGDVTDVLTVKDGLGNTASVSLPVGPAVSISPATPTVAPRATRQLTASGGAGAPYTWTCSSSTGGTISAAGLYTAGAIPGATDSVTATDPVGGHATITVLVGDGVRISPASPKVVPMQVVSFVATGGTGSNYSWVLVDDPSNGFVGQLTGIYKAGATGDTVDQLVASDPLGNTDTTSITVGPGVTVTPASTTVAPLGKYAFHASGGTNSGFHWAVTDNSSGGSVDDNGNYVAGVLAGVSGGFDVVTATDSFGNSNHAVVIVTPTLSVSPSPASVVPLGTVSFTASDGQPPYTFAVVTKGSGLPVINAATGNYRAGAIGSSTDVVRATDANGATFDVTVSVGPGVGIDPPQKAVPPRGSIDFHASGGSGTNFVWSFDANPSGATLDSSGHYRAGSIADQVDVVRATDSLGNFATATVAVGDGVSISPNGITVPPLSKRTLTAVGGAGGSYVFAFAPNGNRSGGTLTTGGAYQAGSLGNSDDTFTATDLLGNVGTATLHVGPGIVLSPPTATLAPLGTQAFNVSGGSGSGYSWILLTNHSGGSVSQAGLYHAGAIGPGDDVVQVTDDLGNLGNATVHVTTPLAISPSATSAAPRGSVTFTASGGAPPYQFALQTSGSGAVITPTGSYTAGTMGGTTDFVQVTDANGATAVGRVTVGPGITVVPDAPTIQPNQSIAFLAIGGAGAPYSWTLTSINSGNGAHIDATGFYTAGNKPGIDVLKVTDALQNSATVNISVGNAMILSPATFSTPPNGGVKFKATNGSGALSWSVITNGSGNAKVNGNGNYKAGDGGNTIDVVQAMDALGDTATATITVGPGLTVAPSKPMVPPGTVINFAVVGGSGTGFTWTISKTGSSGSSIDPATGVYTAGGLGNDTVKVVDSLGNVATAMVQVKVARPVVPPGAEAATPLTVTATPQPRAAPLGAAAPATATGSSGVGCDLGGGAGPGSLAGLWLVAVALLRRRRRAR